MKNKIAVHPETLNYWVNRSWKFARRIMWPGIKFDKIEILLAKNSIERIFLRIPPKHFAQWAPCQFQFFCERVISKIADRDFGPESFFHYLSSLTPELFNEERG